MNQRFFVNYTIGNDAYNEFSKVCLPLGKNVLILGGETALFAASKKLSLAMQDFNIIDTVVYGKECCMKIINTLYERYKDCGADFIVGVGGGKAVDTAKYVAHLMNVPVVTVPTLASNCAASSALSVVYNENHAFEALVHFNKPAYHCFIDTQIILNSPKSFIRAGIGDTLAKYYEVEFSSRNVNKSFSDELGISISNMCHAPLMDNALYALNDFNAGKYSEALENVMLIIIVSTGMVSMLINSDFNGALAHALFYGLTTLEGFEEKYLHGDVVGYGVIVQLMLDNQPYEARKVKKLLADIGVETTLKEREIEISHDILDSVIDSAIADPDMKLVPYPIDRDMVYEAILETEELTV